MIAPVVNTPTSNLLPNLFKTMTYYFKTLDINQQTINQLGFY